MLSLLVEVISDPVAQFMMLVVVLGTWMFFKLIPSWQDGRRLASFEVFEKLCESYDSYKANPNGDIEKARFEFASQKFFKRYVHHRLVAMAFGSDSALSLFLDLRKVAGDLKLEESRFVTKTKNGDFPSRAHADKLLNWGRVIYVAFIVILFSGYFLTMIDEVVKLISVLVMVLSSIPFVISVMLCLKAAHAYRLARVGEMLERKRQSLLKEDRLRVYDLAPSE